MDRIAGDITTTITKKLSPGKDWYSTKELLAAGLPVFAVEKIRRELEQKLIECLLPVQSIWLDPESNTAEKAWKQYVSTIRNAVVLPAAHASDIIQEAVDDCLMLAVQPRTAIPGMLFGEDEELDMINIQKRSSAIVVNAHLAAALERYLQKKAKSMISKDKAADVIAKIDEKLVHGYNPLNWKDLLEPLFALLGGSVPSELLGAFFDDKQKPGFAAAFNTRKKSLTVTDFIEIMSSAEVLDSPAQHTLFTDPDVKEHESPTDSRQKEIAEGDTESGFNAANAVDEHAPDEEITESISETAISFDSEESGDDEPEGINDLFASQHEESVTVEDEYTEEESPDRVPAGSEQEEIVNQELHHTDTKETDDEESEGIDTALHKEETASEEIEHEKAGEEEAFPEVTEDNFTEDEEGIKEETLLSRFVLDDSPDDEEDDIEEPWAPREEKPRTIYDELNLVKEERQPGTIKSLFDDLEEVEPPVRMKASQDDMEGDKDEDKHPASSFEDPLKETGGGMDDNAGLVDHKKKGESETEKEDVELPMWKSFLDRGDVVDDETPFVLDESEDENTVLDEDGFIEKPIYDYAEDDEPYKEAFDNLTNWLADERDRFIDEIFGGSDTAYDIALAEVINYDNWKYASKFLEREIFLRNRIDLYSEVAVDFTDRLHAYFLEYKS